MDRKKGLITPGNEAQPAAGGLGQSPFRKCPLHLPQVISFRILYDRTGQYMVGMEAENMFCPNCGLVMELDNDVLEAGKPRKEKEGEAAN